MLRFLNKGIAATSATIAVPAGTLVNMETLLVTTFERLTKGEIVGLKARAQKGTFLVSVIGSDATLYTIPEGDELEIAGWDVVRTLIFKNALMMGATARLTVSPIFQH